MSAKLLVVNGMIYPVASPEPFKGDILVENGKIAAIGKKLPRPKGAGIFDAAGARVYPGFIDAHTHVGLSGFGVGPAGANVNEAADPVTPHLRAIDALNPAEENFHAAALGGVTTVAAGPGSGNIFGGTFCAVKTAGVIVEEMLIKEAVAMKCALGENPKFKYNFTRMNIAAKFREILFKTREYIAKKEAAAGDTSKFPAFDMKLEAMIPVLKREMPLKVHAHQADDICTAIRITREFNLKLTLDHCTEGHLIAPYLAEAGFPVLLGPASPSASKVELRHRSYETPAILAKAGCLVAIITDGPHVSPLPDLPLHAGIAAKHGMDPFEALKAITVNPAVILGIADRVGSIEIGKDADLVIADGDPLVSSTRIIRTYINGKAVV